MTRISVESEADLFEVEQLFDLAFAPGRAALSSYRLRGEAPPIRALCFCARDDYDVIVGAVRYWPIRIETPPEIENGAAPALLLGPLAIHPTRQGEGVGAQLVLESLEAARGLGWRRVVLVGDAPYYARFGFRRAEIEMPGPTNPDRILAKALVEGAMDGIRGRAAPA